MKKLLIGASSIGAILLIVFAFTRLNIPSNPGPSIQVQEETETSMATPPPSTTATTSATPSQLRAKVRADFISNCDTQGHYGVPVCTCVADYLSRHYSD